MLLAKIFIAPGPMHALLTLSRLRNDKNPSAAKAIDFEATIRKLQESDPLRKNYYEYLGTKLR